MLGPKVVHLQEVLLYTLQNTVTWLELIPLALTCLRLVVAAIFSTKVVIALNFLF